jgi:hypothetical protein
MNWTQNRSIKGFCGAFFLAVSLLIAGCGGNQGDQDLKTNLRIINGLSEIEPIDILIDGRLSFEKMRYLESTGYFSISSGPRDIRAVASGSLTTVAQSTSSLSDDRDQTFLVYGSRDNPRGTIILDDADEPPSGTVKLRAIGVAAQLNSVDIYLIPRNRSVDDFPPTIRGVRLGGSSDYILGLPGTYSLWITGQGTKDVKAFIPNSVFEERRLYTLLIAEAKTGNNPFTVVRIEG